MKIENQDQFNAVVTRMLGSVLVRHSTPDQTDQFWDDLKSLRSYTDPAPLPTILDDETFRDLYNHLAPEHTVTENECESSGVLIEFAVHTRTGKRLVFRRDGP